MPYHLSLGPFHPGWPGALRIDLQVESGIVQTAESVLFRPDRLRPEDWSGLSLEEGLVGIERLCASASWAFTLAYCQALEVLAGLEVPPRARYLRLLLAELERSISHLLTASRILRLVGLSTTAMTLLDLREAFLDARQHLTGRRFFSGLNIPGGMQRDLDDLSAIGDLIRRTKGPLYRLSNHVFSDRAFAGHMVGVGLLTKEQAEDDALGGPLARASEVNHDLRQDRPYAAYAEMGVQVVTQSGGDAFARWVIFLLEVFESLRLLETVVQRLPAGPVRPESLIQIHPGKAEGWVEASFGPLMVRLEIEQANNVSPTPDDDATVEPGFQLASLWRTTPGPAQLAALSKTLQGQQLARIGAIVASWGLCQPCLVR